MGNLDVYNKLRAVPEEAKKTIGAGRLKGMTDVSPMYRIKVMTEVFGVCGFGWKYTITKQWTELYDNEIKGFCNIDLYVKMNGEWSDAIPGTGGSSFVTMEKNGAYVNDEVYKMALTDALSVAMKALGVAADVYYQKDADYGTKYEPKPEAKPAAKKAAPAPSPTPEKSPMESLEEAFNLVKAEIAEAKSQKELRMIFAKKGNLQSYQPFKDALNKRFKEVPA